MARTHGALREWARHRALRERMRYRFDNVMSRGTPALIGLLGLASLALIAVVSALALVLTPGEAGSGAPSVLWKSVLHTLDTGQMGSDQGAPAFVGLMLVVTLGGIFIVSALVGVLATGLDARFAELRKGRSRIVERGHTVVLGWSDQVFTIISELVKANEGNRTCIAILAERDKVEMEDEIRVRLRRTGRVRVVCRTGTPSEPTDLELMRPDDASVILVPARAGDSPDVHLIRTLLALGQREWHERRPAVVGVVTDSLNLPAATLAGGPGVQLIDARDLTARLVVQSRRHPGLSAVCTELLDFDGDEIYMRAEPALAGMAYGDALLAYETAAVIGVRTGDSVALNPPMDTKIGPEDEMVLIAASSAAVRLAAAPVPVVDSAISAVPPRHTGADRTLMLGWDSRGPTIVGLLDRYLPAGSALEIAGTAIDDGTTAGIGQLRNLTLTTTRCDPTDRRALEALQPGRFQHVIVLADDAIAPEYSDSQAMVTLLHLRDMKERGGDDYPIVSELHNDANRRLAQVTRADDFVVGGRMISLLLTQLATNQHLSSVFAELFDAEGSEIYLKLADEYVTPGVQANFATVIEAAARRGETAIGYRLKAQTRQPPLYGVVLNPDKAQPLTLGPADRVAVLARG